MAKSILFLLISSAVVYASEEAHHIPHSDEIIKAVGPQIFNFALFIGLLIFLLRKPISSFFSSRLNNYRAALKAASSALAEAQAKKAEIVNNIQNLERTRSETIRQAQQDAQALKDNIVSEAKLSAKKFLEEAERTVKIEIEKAKAEIREQLLQQSIQNAEKSLRDQLDVNEQKRLQKEFATKI